LVCWDLKERGAVGETCLHLCLLNATSIHADLAKRLLRFYPKLINDIYMCDEYYGKCIVLGLRFLWPQLFGKPFSSKRTTTLTALGIVPECLICPCLRIRHSQL
jgi:hypothetical protein